MDSFKDHSFTADEKEEYETLRKKFDAEYKTKKRKASRPFFKKPAPKKGNAKLSSRRTNKEKLFNIEEN